MVFFENLVLPLWLDGFDWIARQIYALLEDLDLWMRPGSTRARAPAWV